MVQKSRTAVQISNKGKAMTHAAECQEIIKDVWPVTRTGSVKASLWAAYEYLSERVTERPVTLRRVETMWHGNIKSPRSEEVDALRLAKIEEAFNERAEIKARLAVLDERLASVDAGQGGVLAS